MDDLRALIRFRHVFHKDLYRDLTGAIRDPAALGDIDFRHRPLEIGIRQPVTERILHHAVISVAVFIGHVVPIAFGVGRFVPLITDIDVFGIVHVPERTAALIHLGSVGGRVVVSGCRGKIVRVRIHQASRRRGIAQQDLAYGLRAAVSGESHRQRGVYVIILKEP